MVLEDRRVGYDYLVLATGARHSYFGMDEWEAVAPGLKKIADATHIRERVLLAFERAEITSDPEERRRLLTFVVIGGGPTGVEMAGAVAELASQALAADFRVIDPKDARVVLVEGGAARAAHVPREPVGKARRRSSSGWASRSGWALPCSTCDADGVVAADERIESAHVDLGRRRDRLSGRKMAWRRARPRRPDHGRTRPFRAGLHRVCSRSATRQPITGVPGIAPAAKQMGAYVGRADRRGICAAERSSRPFRYRHHGNLATIGRRAAVADFGRIQLSGFPAWLIWALAHVWFLIGWRNRFVVGLNWLWNYVTFERGARLITASAQESHEAQIPSARAAA